MLRAPMLAAIPSARRDRLTRGPARWARLLALPAALLASPVAGAEPEASRIAVLPVIVAGSHGDATEVSVREDVRDVLRFRGGISQLPDDELYGAGRGGLGTSLRDCDADTACLVARLENASVRLGLIVVVNQALDPPFLSVQLVDTNQRRAAGTWRGSVAPEAGAIGAELRRVTAQLLEQAGHPPLARLIVEVSPPSAQVRVSGGALPELGSLPRFLLPTGSYDVLATLPDPEDASTRVEVVAGKEAHVALILEPSRSVLGSPWLWTAIGVAVAGGALAAILASTQPSERCLCIYGPGTGCQPCP